MRRSSSLVWAVLGLWAATGGTAWAQQKRTQGTLTLEDVPEIPRALVDRMQQFTNTRGASLLDFAPDGPGILISTRFGDTAQVHSVAGPGMDRQQVTFFAEPAVGAAYDPAAGSGGMYFRMDTGGNEFYQVYWLDRSTGRATLLSDGASRNEGLQVSNKGNRAVYMSTRRNKKDFDLYLVEKHDPSTTRLVKELDGQWNALDWDAADARVLLQKYVSINESYLHVLDLATGTMTQLGAPAATAKGKKKPVPIAYGSAVFSRTQDAVFLTSDEDSEFTRLQLWDLKTGKRTVLSGAINWDITAVTISNDGARLAYVANEGGRSALFLASTADPTKATRVDLPQGVVNRLRFDAAGARLGITLATPRASADVFTVDTTSLAVTRWTFSEMGGLNTASLVEPTLISFKSFDGKMIPSWLFRPRPSDKPAPVVISIHGGPEAQSMATFDPLVQYWVTELGAAVLVPNVRGSSGYGKTYLTLDNGPKREDSVKDIGALLDWVATQKDLDASRVAVFGGSYGGYMVLASLAAYPARIRCGVDIVGISNFVTFLEHTEAYRQDLRRAEYGDERDPKMRALLEKISPTTNATKITSPLFVIQGQNDPRVPVTEAEQMVRTVRGAGRPVWYLVAADEGHGFQKKKNRDVLMQTAVLFLQQHLTP